MRKRPPTVGRGVTTRDMAEQRLIKRFRASILQSRTRRAGGASGGTDDDDDEADDETGDELIDQYDNHRPSTAHGFIVDCYRRGTFGVRTHSPRPTPTCALFTAISPPDKSLLQTICISGCDT